MGGKRKSVVGLSVTSRLQGAFLAKEVGMGEPVALMGANPLIVSSDIVTSLSGPAGYENSDNIGQKTPITLEVWMAGPPLLSG